MSLNKIRNRGLSTVASVSVVSTVMSPFYTSALNFNGGYDEEKKVYYLISEGNREEFNSVLSFVFAFLREIFAFDKKVKKEDLNKNGSNISAPSNVSENKVSVKEDNSIAAYKAVTEIMKELGQEDVLKGENCCPFRLDKNSDSGSYSCYFCTKDRYKSCKRGSHVDTRVAKVTVDEEKITVDYKVVGLDKVIAVNFSEDNSLQEAAVLLESIRLHGQFLSSISCLRDKGADIFVNPVGTIKVRADDRSKWYFFADNCGKCCVIEEVVISKYSFVTLRYKDGKDVKKEVSYDLTNVKDAKVLQNVFESSRFDKLPRNDSESDDYLF